MGEQQVAARPPQPDRLSFSTVFHELVAILVIAGLMGVLALKLRQPLIISSIVTGIVAGATVLGCASV